MRLLSLKIGLLPVFLAVGAACAAEGQQDDKSYLPPQSLQAKPGPARKAAAVEHTQHTAAKPERKRVRAVHRRHAPHYAYQPRFAPRFFFGLF